ncbi:putative Tetratricopeptide repeat protein [Candidatus Magnetomoraceae bacterium gMMP-15]
MDIITIREKDKCSDGFNATVSFDADDKYKIGRGKYNIKIKDPFSKKEEKRLEWYFEKYYEFPFVNELKAKKAAESITTYGESLFDQIFENRKIYANYRQINIHDLCFEIVGSPDFHQLHWETLKDSDKKFPFVRYAPMVRDTENEKDYAVKLDESPKINILIVTARPYGHQDVGFRTISRPIVEKFQKTKLPVEIKIIRPGTYEALEKHLEAIQEDYTQGYYHIIHFDMHGAIKKLKGFDGKQAFLFFEGTKEKNVIPVSADKIAQLLEVHKIPITILNACQSGKEVSASEASLGSRLLTSGVQTVVAMGYSVNVEAAKLMMEAFYRKLLEKKNISLSIKEARSILYKQKKRGAYFGKEIKLEDWMLPVVYQSGGVGAETIIPIREFTSDEEDAFYTKRSNRYKDYIKPKYGEFFGRDIDILQIEKKFLENESRNILIVKGMVGVGKTMLLQHLGEWWQTTKFIKEVFYYDINNINKDEYTLQYILNDIENRFSDNSSKKLRIEVQQEKVIHKYLSDERHLIILDNLNSAINKEQQEDIRNFLSDLLGKATLILIGTRANEDWLIKNRRPLRENDIYELQGLDNESASELTERIINSAINDSEKREEYLKSQELQEVLQLLRGYPLALEDVLENLRNQNISEILNNLKAVNTPSDSKMPNIISRFVNFSIEKQNDNLSNVLSCLALFTRVFDKDWANNYLKYIQEYSAFDLSDEIWEEGIKELTSLGRIAKKENLLYFQPTFSYFLRTRLSEEHPDIRKSIKMAFLKHYIDVGATLTNYLPNHPDTQEHQLAKFYLKEEYENFETALKIALSEKTSFFDVYYPIASYLTKAKVKNWQKLKEISQWTYDFRDNYDDLKGKLGYHFLMVAGNIVESHIYLNEIELAEKLNKNILSKIKEITDVGEENKEKLKALTFQRYGTILMKKLDWQGSEKYFEDAKDIFKKFKDYRCYAVTCHKLGILFEEQNLNKYANYYEMRNKISGMLKEISKAEYDENKLKKIYEALDELLEQQLEDKGYLNDPTSKTLKNLVNMGITHQENGELDKAEKSYIDALKISIELKDKKNQAIAYHNLGRLSQQREEFDQAKAYLDNAESLFKKIKDKRHQGIVIYQKGTLYHNQKKCNDAKEAYIKSFEYLEEIGDKNFLGNIMKYDLIRLRDECEDRKLQDEIKLIINKIDSIIEN